MTKVSPMFSAIVAAVVLSASAMAQDGPPAHAFRAASPTDPSNEVFIPRDKADVLELAEWDSKSPRGDTVQIVWGRDEVAKAPAAASKYVQRSYVFPTGTIRVLEFKKETGGMIHMITSETALYMLKGAGRVGVAGKDVEIAERDLVSYPSGVLRGSGDATVILWTVTGAKLNEAAKSKVVRAADAVEVNSAEWDEGGKRVRGRTPEELAKAPKNAIRLKINRYDFDGNSVRVTVNYKGGPTSPVSGSKTDSLIYVTGGRLQHFQDGESMIAVPGDAIREAAGSTNYWIRLEDSSFVATSSQPVVPAAPKSP
jgi:quercetin dioxygenase-like cupin family protein